MFDSILNMIEKYNTIIIHRHCKPDGDALGSQIGLKHILLENFPHKDVHCVGDNAGFFSFMEDSCMDDVPYSLFSNALSIILDCGSPALISDCRYQSAAATIRMDHHIFTEKIADKEFVDSTFESCCGIVTFFAKETGLRLNPKAAKALYTGMVTDSGRFRYDTTTARTHMLAGLLLEQKVDCAEIFRNLYADTFENKKIKAQFVLKTAMTVHRVAYIYTTREEFQALGLDAFTVSRGMVNTMADIKGVDIWVNFTETGSGVLCELRSSTYNINPIAVKYGGGGHAKASGAVVPDRETAMVMLQDLDNMIGEAK